MYVYIKSEQQLWTVGFYTTLGEWIAESDVDILSEGEGEGG